MEKKIKTIKNIKIDKPSKEAIELLRKMSADKKKRQNEYKKLIPKPPKNETD